MKKISAFVLSLFVLLGLFVPSSNATSLNFCEQYKGIKDIWWNGIELKNGQIGRLIVINDTPLYTTNAKGGKIVSRTLKKGEFYRIYAFKSEKLYVGGAYFVIRDASKVRYETPSKSKLEVVQCINGTHLTQRYSKHINTESLWSLFERLNIVYEKSKTNKYDYNLIVQDLEPLADEYRELPALTSAQKNIFGTIFTNSINPTTPNQFEKILIRFKNNETYLMPGYYRYKTVNNKQYLGIDAFERIYGVFTNNYRIVKAPNLPGGLNGRIDTFLGPKYETVYTDMNNINSKSYTKYTMETVGFPSYSNFDSRAYHYTGVSPFSTYDLNEIQKFFNNRGALKFNGDILEININELPNLSQF